MEVIRPGEHGSTFGGNPLASAVGIASLDVIESEKLVERSAARGEYLRRRLQEAIAPVAHRVQEIRGKGLMTGVDLAPSVGKARPICEKLAALGVLVKDTREQTIRITPPLVIEEQEIDWMCEQFREALAD
jgi:ornithine--oxo-acid transaminase